MTGFKLRQGNAHGRPAGGKKPVSLWKQGRRAFQRYLLISTGISSTALGLALIVSVVVATHARPAAGPELAVSEVEVSQIEGRYMATALDTTLAVVAPEMAPSTAAFPFAPPAPPLDVAPGEAEPPQVALSFPAQSETLPASPPATDLDAEATPPPLDPAAAALPQPLLAQELAEADEQRLREEAEAAEIAPPGGLPAIGQVHGVNVTFYDCLDQGFCGVMYNGEPVYEGAAACSWDLPLGTQFVIENDPTGRVYVCADRGLLADTWVDIFFYSPADGWAWQKYVGRYATIHIISVPSFEPQS